MKKIVIFVFFLFNFFNAKAQLNEVVNVRLISMIELIANSEIHHDEKIITTGYFKYSGGDMGVIFLSEETSNYNLTKNAFVVYFSNDNLKNLKLKELNNHYIEISGYFNANNKGYLNYYDGSISYIESLNGLLKWRKQK